MRHDLGHDSYYDFDPAWLDADEGDRLLQTFIEAFDWEARAIIALGKSVMQPRLIAWCGDVPYKYSGQILEPRPFTDELSALNQRVSAEVGVPFNHVLLNRYRDGADHMGMHADDERPLGQCPTIAALSLGVTRKFLFRHKHRRRYRKQIKLTHGSLLVMGGATQHKFHHGVPKQEGAGERINVTFRKIASTETVDDR